MPREEELPPELRGWEKLGEIPPGMEGLEPGPTLVGGLWAVVRNFFEICFKAVWTGFVSMIPLLISEAWLSLLRFVKPPTETALNWSFNLMESFGVMDRDDLRSLEKVKEVQWPLNVVLTEIIAFVLLLGYLKTKAFAMLGTMQQDLNKVHSPLPPSPHEILMSAFVAPEKTGEVRDALQRSGLSDPDIDLMFLSAYRLYNEEIIRTLWLRGVLSEDQMFMRMRELGYTDTRIKEMIQSWPVIPPAIDIFRMVAKEAFEPDFVEKIGLSAEFPVEQTEWLKKQGISEEWALKYWYAHWEQPSIGQGFEMLHRGVIDEDILDLLFRAVEIPPFWREKLTKIAYMPYTRVDVRRMHDMGVLTDEELIRSYMDLGYDEEHALKMAEFTIRYNRQHEKDLTRSQILTGYKDKLITREDAKALLMQTDYSEAQVEYFLALEDYKQTKELQDDILKNIEDRFENNLIDEFEARKRLGQLALSGEKINVMIDSWKIKRFEDRKLPSKSDLDKMLRSKIINEDTYRLEMQKLGYGFNYIDWYLELSRKKK